MITIGSYIELCSFVLFLLILAILSNFINSYGALQQTTTVDGKILQLTKMLPKTIQKENRIRNIKLALVIILIVFVSILLILSLK